MEDEVHNLISFFVAERFQEIGIDFWCRIDGVDQVIPQYSYKQVWDWADGDAGHGCLRHFFIVCVAQALVYRKEIHVEGQGEQQIGNWRDGCEPIRWEKGHLWIVGACLEAWGCDPVKNDKGDDEDHDASDTQKGHKPQFFDLFDQDERYLHHRYQKRDENLLGVELVQHIAAFDCFSEYGPNGAFEDDDFEDACMF